MEIQSCEGRKQFYKDRRIGEEIKEKERNLGGFCNLLGSTCFISFKIFYLHDVMKTVGGVKIP